jgi:hypothetical protein
VANAGRSLTCPKGGSLDGYALCQSYHVLIFLEIKSLPRRHLLLRFFGRYGRSQESLQAVRKRSRRDARLSASAPPPMALLGIRAAVRVRSWLLRPAAFPASNSANESPDERLFNGEVYVRFSGGALFFAEVAHGLTTELTPHGGD